jgi:bidirectional [NiFe] hydrogenase diaphorase subunit
MQVGQASSPPSTDKRWRVVDATMRRNGHQPIALIEALHTVQESFGFLDDDSLRYVANSLRVPLSRAYGVATFYNFFTMKPPGRHSCVICMGTACYIKGAAQLLKSIEDTAGVKPGETTADGEVSLLVARCIGSCGLAPAGVFDGEVVAKMTPAVAAERVGRWTNQ